MNDTPTDVPATPERIDELSNRPIAMLDPAFIPRMKAGECTSCQKKIDPADFRDSLSRKEYNISGMCQQCQDSVFGAADDDFDLDEEDVELL